MVTHGILSTPTYDPDGYLPIEYTEQTAGLFDFDRTAVAVKTLDGGVVLDNMGVFDAGRVLTIATRVDDDAMRQIRTLCRTYERLHLSTAEGFFVVCPMQGGWKEPGLVLQLTILEKLA